MTSGSESDELSGPAAAVAALATCARFPCLSRPAAL